MKATANGAAQAHEKGATKVNQEIEAVRRDLKGLGIYKMFLLLLWVVL